MLKVVSYPDPILGERARPIERIDGRLLQLAKEMFETMYEDRGIGLAAPQVGQGVRMCVVNCTGKSDGEIVLINPVVAETGGGEVTEEEGCLSVPGIRSKVTRFAEVRVRAYDPDGNELDIEADGLEARCLQHEIDHLNGRLFFQRLNEAAKMTIRHRLKKLEETFQKG